MIGLSKDMPITIDVLSAFLHEKYAELGLIPFPIKEMVFEERVKQKCYRENHRYS